MDIKKEEYKKSIKKYMAVRLIVITITLLSAIFAADPSIRTAFIVLVGIAYLVGIVYTFLLQRIRHLYALAYLQLTVDTAIVSAVVSVTQSISSPFTFLYVLCIFAAGLLLSFKGCIVISTIASALYSGIIFLEFKGIFNPPPFTGLEGMDSLAVFFTVYVKICAFYMVSLLSAYLAASQRRRIERMENDLSRANKFSSLGELSASLVHEIKNPLSAISSSAEYLQKEFNLDAYVKRLLEIIVSQTKQLELMVSRFLALARIEKKDLSTFSLSTALDETLMLVNGPISKKVKIKKNFENDLNVTASREQIGQVFLNIILNALQSMPDGGELNIVGKFVEKDSGDIYSKIDFIDKGSGISEKEIEKIFEPFYTTKEKGTGLGLAITKSFLEAHGGRIEVASKKGKGSVFSIYLPKDAGSKIK